MSLSGLRVLSLESRRAAETAELIRRNDGEPFVAPSMREVPVEHNEEAFRFGERLLRGDFDMTIFLTGVGTRFLMKLLETRFALEDVKQSLQRTAIVVRGSKPAAAIRELGLTPTVIAPEPNTWHEVMAVTADRPERRVAVQEYGRPSSELYDALRARGAEVTPVTVYQWELPQDTGPLREAARRIADGQVDVVLFTSGVQITHLLQVSRELGLERKVLNGLRRCVVGSIGPTTTEMLGETGLRADLEPEHPKLGMLVKEAAERAQSLLAAKKADESPGA